MHHIPGARVLLICACVLLSACTAPPKLHRHTVLVFGTLVEISVTDTEEQVANDAFLYLEDMLLSMHADWTPWQDSDLSRVNTAIREGRAFDLPSSLHDLVDESMQYYELTEGMFNPAIGELIKLWQFHRHDDPELMPPGASMINAFLQRAPRITDLQQKDGQWTSNNTAVDLNFGANAKGIAVALAVSILRSRGINHAVVNAGGDLAVSGENRSVEPARPWSIGIRHPREATMLASIAVRDGEAVFTSGDYERFYIRDGERYHHILDPRTGYPTDGASSVTVIHEDAARADVAATALMVAGARDWQRIAGKLELDYVMLVDMEGNVHMTPAMSERVNVEVEPRPRIILSDLL